MGRRSLTVGAAVLAVIALAIVGVKFLAGSHSNSTASTTTPNNAISTAAGAATTGASPKASATRNPVATKKTGYLLTTPATAGGYPLLATVPSYVQGPANTAAQTVRSSVVSNGGKVTGKVTAAYQLSGGQVMAFTGYMGTFTPAKVIASLGANAQSYSAGSHGGSLACFTVTSGSRPGTACVWATTTTIGITEFFSSVGPEQVTDQAKAAADTLKFRDSVEHSQS